MSIEIKAPTLPESVPDGTIATWYKKEGESVSRDELLVDIETDKVVIEVVSPTDGVLKEIIKQPGDTIVSNEAIGSVEAGAAGDKPAQQAEQKQAPADTGSADSDKNDSGDSSKEAAGDSGSDDEPMLSPAAKKLIEENNLDAASIQGSGKDGRVTKEDVLNKLEGGQSSAPQASAQSTPTVDDRSGRVEERVPMSRLRAKVAERLLQATQTTAMLTTFNEVNMQPVMDIRSRYKEQFEKTHDGVRLGFMSFFVRACIEALKRFPAVNASIDGRRAHV